MNKLIDRGTRVLYCLFLGLILILLMFFSGMEHACQRTFLLPDYALMLGGLLVLAAGAYLPLPAAQGRRYGWWVLGMCLLLFAVQLLVATQTYFWPGWDADTVLINANTLAFGDTWDLSYGYYATYPNNLLITVLEKWLLQLAAWLGIGEPQRLLVLAAVNCAINSLSCALVYRTLCIMARPRTALLGFGLSVALFGLSPWTLVPYTDSLALVFPILMLWNVLRPAATRAGKAGKWALLGILAGVGYAIKPQTLIVAIAVGLVALGQCFGKGQYKRLPALLLSAALVVTCFVGVRLGLNQLYVGEGFELEPDERFGVSHYLMMGLNETTNGVWSPEDVALSAECNGADERTRTNLTQSAQRLADMGVGGYARHLAKKTLVNYDDGTFAWGMEGVFFKESYDAPDTTLAPLLRGLTYPDGAGFALRSTLAQAVWLLVLMLCFCAGLGAGERGRCVLLLSLVGLMLFEALFEARARYLYHFAPLFCVAAALGLQNLRRLARRPLRRPDGQ